MEKAGKPAIVVTTDKFVELGRLVAQSLGMPDLHFEVIPHPFGGLKPEVAEDRGRQLADAIAQSLESQSFRQG